MAYRVYGAVVEEESGKPLSGLLVRAYDKDLIRDDHLGDARTDVDGAFALTFTEIQFKDFNETLPDLYVRVYDATGKHVLYTTEKTPRSNTFLNERFDIRIPRAKLAAR